MIVTAPFKKSFLISLAGHIALFGILGFSFGAKTPPVKFCEVHFWGGVLRACDLLSMPRPDSRGVKYAFEKRKDALMPEKMDDEDYPFSGSISIKPQVKFEPGEEKSAFKPSHVQGPEKLRAKESVIMFYPRLPYDASLYFKDRQVVHIELAFNIASNVKYNSVAIKRKVSSGNLEADLLSMRYISRYLYIQQAGLRPDNWHTVKIDLSTR